MNYRSQGALFPFSVCVCVEVLEPEAPSNNLWLSVSVRRSDEFRSDSVSRSPEAQRAAFHHHTMMDG